MRRRLTILFVDAVVLGGLAAVVMLLVRLDTSPTNAAELRDAVPVLEVDASRPSLRTGRVAVSARVVAERSTHLIMPGDKVDVTRGGGGIPVLRNAEILSIDPPLMSDDDRLLVTFSLTGEKAAQLRSLRQETLLFVRLASVGTPPARAGFEPPQPQEVITLRFDERNWSKRLSTQ